MPPSAWRGKSECVGSSVTTVAVLGGGVGGLSAAHELAERGFDVTVYEAREDFGGKARSMPVPGSGTGGRADLPAEHGFRFFPGFYRHLPDTMAADPGRRADGVPATSSARRGSCSRRPAGATSSSAPRTRRSRSTTSRSSSRFLREWATRLGIPAHEHAFFIERLLALLTRCDERRFGQWERQSWWEFSAPRSAARRSGSSSPTG